MRSVVKVAHYVVTVHFSSLMTFSWKPVERAMKSGKIPLVTTKAILIAAAALLFPWEILVDHTVASADAAPLKTRRLALIVGTNDGGAERVRLRYANGDATTFADVLTHLGGLEKDDTVLVEDVTSQSLLKGIDDLLRRINRLSTRKERLEVIFYYSGHSDEHGLLLGDEIFPYPRLKTLITGLPVDVRIMILDSCSSGSLTLTKGGTKKPAFLLDASVNTKGHAIITSSSSDEAAQESSRISGSFFTHYLVSGLRGAADFNTDKRVTLSEAYQYAYAETLARTEQTQSGPQHPSYDFNLAGTGDLILTDLSESSAQLFFTKDLNGRFFVRNQEDQLVAEVKKNPGRPLSLGVEPGTYKITWAQDGKYRESITKVAAQETRNVESLTFVDLQGEPAVARGGGEFSHHNVSFQSLPRWNSTGGDPLTESHNFVAGLIWARSGRLDGLSLNFGGHAVAHGVSGAQFSFGANWNEGFHRGAQFAFGLNVTGAGVQGAQFAMANWNEGPLTGAQVGYVNYSQGDIYGMQTGMVNVSGGKTYGPQFGLVNVGTGSHYGPQFGLFNFAPDVPMQSGFLNISGDTYTQIGLLNISSKTNVALGLVNYANEANVALGLLSWIGNGTRDIAITVDELGFTHLTVRSGSKYLYTIYDGAARDSRTENPSALAIGLGGQVSVAALWIKAEILGVSYQARTVVDGTSKRSGARSQIIAELEVLPRLAISLSPTYNVYFHDEATFENELSKTFEGKLWSNERTTRWLGYQAGLRYRFAN